MSDLHVHLPAGFTGQVIQEGNVITIQPAADLPSPAPPAGDSDPPGVETMLQRFEGYDPRTPARRVCDALVDRGWRLSPRGRATARYPPMRATCDLSTRDQHARRG